MRKLDRTDIGILNSLQENARITNADLARSVNLSPTPCFNRVKAMEERGIKCSIVMPRYKNKTVSMWTLIPQKLMPPTRLVRYCCAVLK